MKRSSLLTRLQFSYTYALLQQWFRPAQQHSQQRPVVTGAAARRGVAQRA